MIELGIENIVFGVITTLIPILIIYLVYLWLKKREFSIPKTILAIIGIATILSHYSAYGPRTKLESSIPSGPAGSTGKIQRSDFIEKQNQWDKFDKSIKKHEERQSNSAND